MARDRELALLWYGRAKERGSKDAEQALARLQPAPTAASSEPRKIESPKSEKVEDDKKQNFSTVVRAISPAVVVIIAQKDSPAGVAKASDQSSDPFLENHPLREFLGDEFLKRFFGNTNAKSESNRGLGIIFDPRGYVVTWRNILRGADKINVETSDQKSFKARVISADPKSGVAVIKIDGGPFPYAKFGDSDHLMVGESVASFSRADFFQTDRLQVGKVKAKGVTNTGLYDLEDFVQTDIPTILPGEGGNPLVNKGGEVVGINVATMKQTERTIGTFAISSNIAKKVIDAVLVKEQKNRSTRIPTPDELFGREFPSVAAPGRGK